MDAAPQRSGPDLGPAEELAGPRSGFRRSGAFAVVAAIIIALALLLRHGHHASIAVPGPGPSPSADVVPITRTAQASAPAGDNPAGTLGPALTVGSRFLRFDPVRHQAFVEMILTPGSNRAIVLTGIKVSDAPIPMQLQFVDASKAQADLMAPLGQVLLARNPPGSPNTLLIPSGGQGALEIYLEPDCARAPYPTYPYISLDFSSAGGAHSFGIPPDLSIVTNWFNDAVAEACGGIRSPDVLIDSRTVSGLRMTTVGPRAPTGTEPFVVTVTAQNQSSTTFSGDVGVLLFDRAHIGPNGNLLADVGLNMIELAGDSTLIGWTVVGPPEAGIEAVGSGALRTHVTLAPRATARYQFLFQFQPPENVLGPATGWVPAAMPAQQTAPSYPDPGTFPTLSRPIVRATAG